MLEIKNLVKIYKTKGGQEVRALDGVSLKFEEKGMVFLLGKSGSGKSTLLNLCGGLDSPDSGEIIIKGRSSKDFTQSDFDSYRNTFIGFVFQEYNILNEFSVEDNIALALELQGKNKNKKEVADILKQVDLENFARRKPNTLSGGQKQRVAIARALVKNPEIIMADEPTGALDSNTGKQVFDTLKKLSAQKLVIVVSHDREFAEVYGDRIIELKDGKIISDITKTRIAAEKKSENLSFVGEDTISVKSGSRLTKEDFERINEFLSQSSGDVIITNGQREIQEFRKAARIDENGARESFKTTDETKLAAKDYTEQDSRFIRSKLPARHAVKIGASSLKIKPFRLIFTIFLSMIAFTLFGLFSTLTFYDEAATAYETYASAGVDGLLIKDSYTVTQVYYENGKEQDRSSYGRDTLFTPEDLAGIRAEYGKNALGIFNYSDNVSNELRPANVTAGTDFNSIYYNYSLKGFAETSDAWGAKELLTPQTDVSSLGENDVIISSYTFESIKEGELYTSADYKTDPSPVRLNDYGDIVGKKLIFETGGNQPLSLNIAGVFDSNLPDKYDNLKDSANAQHADYADTLALINELNSGLYRYALVSEEFYEAHFEDFGGGYVQDGDQTDYGFKYLYKTLEASAVESNYTEYVSAANSLPPSQGVPLPNIAFFDGRTDTRLSDGEIVVPFNIFYHMNDLSTKIFEYYFDPVNELIETINALWDEYNALIEQENYEQADIVYEQAEEAQKEYTAADENARERTTTLDKYINFIMHGYYEYWDTETESYERIIPTQEEMLAAVGGLNEFIEETADTEYAYATTFTFTFTDTGMQFGTFEIAGYYYRGTDENFNLNGVYFSEDRLSSLLSAANDGGYNQTFIDYVRPQNARFNYIYVPVAEADGSLKTLLGGEGAENANHTFYNIVSPIADGLNNVNYFIETLWQVFLYVGIVMALFAMLLLFNFISVSIANKKKEIGILRAVGARSADVFKIFYSESAIITAICYALAMIVSFAVCSILNSTVAGALGAAIFVFGPASWLVMLGIALLTSFIATFLPVYSIARRKPVESIRAL